MTNTIPNVPRELLERAATSIERRMCLQCEGVPCCMPESLNTLSDIRALLSAQSSANHVEDVRAMVADPSPAGVDGLEVATFLHTLHMELGQTEQFCSKWKGDPFGVSGVDYSSTYAVTSDPLCRLSDAQAIIDGLRGEVAGLRKRAKTAEREAGSALRTYKGLEKVARVVSDNSDQVCGELNVLRQQFDQQAQRIGELEGLLRGVHGWIDESARVYRHNSTSVMLYRIDAALSAGKEGE